MVVVEGRGRVVAGSGGGGVGGHRGSRGGGGGKGREGPGRWDRIGRRGGGLGAGEGLLAVAGDAGDAGQHESTAENVARASIEVAKARAWTTEVSLEASNLLFELGGSRASLREHHFDRHWRNARTHTLHDPVRWKYPAIGNYLLNDVLPPRRGTI